MNSGSIGLSGRSVTTRRPLLRRQSTSRVGDRKSKHVSEEIRARAKAVDMSPTTNPRWTVRYRAAGRLRRRWLSSRTAEPLRSPIFSHFSTLRLIQGRRERVDRGSEWREDGRVATASGGFCPRGASHGFPLPVLPTRRRWARPCAPGRPAAAPGRASARTGARTRHPPVHTAQRTPQYERVHPAQRIARRLRHLQPVTLRCYTEIPARSLHPCSKHAGDQRHLISSHLSRPESSNSPPAAALRRRPVSPSSDPVPVTPSGDPVPVTPSQ